MDAAESAASPTHTLDVDSSEGRLRIRLRDGDVLPDRDCVLVWQPRREADRPTLQMLRHDDPSGAASHFLALVVPAGVRDGTPDAPARGDRPDRSLGLDERPEVGGR